MAASSAPKRLAGEQAHEEHGGEGEEAEDRHRLQDVEQRDQHQGGATALGGPGGVGEGEQQREDEGGEHPERGAQRVAGQVGGVEMDHRAGVGGQRRQGAARGVGDGDQQAEDEQHGGGVEQVGQAAQRGERRERRVGHARGPCSRDDRGPSRLVARARKEGQGLCPWTPLKAKPLKSSSFIRASMASLVAVGSRLNGFAEQERALLDSKRKGPGASGPSGSRAEPWPFSHYSLLRSLDVHP